MLKVSLLAGACFVLSTVFSQKKYIDTESPGVVLKVEKNQLSQNQFNALLKFLETDQLNSNFVSTDPNTVVFNHKLTDQTRLNDVHASIQSKVNPFLTKVEFANINELATIYYGEKIMVNRYTVQNLNTLADGQSLRDYMLRESKVCFVHTNHITHEVFVIYDVVLGEEIIKEILSSHQNGVIGADEISKYY